MNAHVVGGLPDLALMPINADLSHAMCLPDPDMTSGFTDQNMLSSQRPQR